MRKSMTIRLDPEILEQARKHAAAENRTLTNYIETLLRRDLRLVDSGPAIEVIAPTGLRGYRPVPVAGESRRRREFRKRLFTALLDESGS